MTYFWLFQFFIFFIIVNIFLAILNDAYIAVQEQFADIDEDEVEEISMRERYRRLKQWYKQRQMDLRIEQLRALQRRREMLERREERRKEEEQARVLKSMGMYFNPIKGPPKNGTRQAAAPAPAPSSAPSSAPAAAPAADFFDQRAPAPAADDAATVVGSSSAEGEQEGVEMQEQAGPQMLSGYSGF